MANPRLLERTLDILRAWEPYSDWRSAVFSSGDDRPLFVAHITRGSEDEAPDIIFTGTSRTLGGAVNSLADSALGFIREQLAIADGTTLEDLADQARAYALATCDEYEEPDEEEDDADDE